MRLAILSDLHANIISLKRVIRDIKNNSVDHLVILGDLIGYYYWPIEVIEILSDFKCTIIKGNHEDCLNKELDNSYNHGIRLANDLLTKSQKEIIIALPDKEELITDNLKILFKHSFLENNGILSYVYPNKINTGLKNVIDIEYSYDYIFIGHSHHQFICSFNGIIIANPGSVGQPRDIGNLASYIIFDTENKTIIPRRISFPTKELKEMCIKFDPQTKYLYEIFNRNVYD